MKFAAVVTRRIDFNFSISGSRAAARTWGRGDTRCHDVAVRAGRRGDVGTRCTSPLGERESLSLSLSLPPCGDGGRVSRRPHDGLAWWDAGHSGCPDVPFVQSPIDPIARQAEGGTIGERPPPPINLHLRHIRNADQEAGGGVIEAAPGVSPGNTVRCSKLASSSFNRDNAADPAADHFWRPTTPRAAN